MRSLASLFLHPRLHDWFASHDYRLGVGTAWNISSCFNLRRRHGSTRGGDNRFMVGFSGLVHASHILQPFHDLRSSGHNPLLQVVQCVAHCLSECGVVNLLCRRDVVLGSKHVCSRRCRGSCVHQGILLLCLSELFARICLTADGVSSKGSGVFQIGRGRRLVAFHSLVNSFRYLFSSSCSSALRHSCGVSKPNTEFFSEVFAAPFSTRYHE